MRREDEEGLVQTDDLPVEHVRITSLSVGDSPRRGGERSEYTRTLAGVPGPLPPILVHRPTMTVIDGIHRLRAAQLRGEEEIEARFFDGDVDAAFVLAVQANARNGLPLSLADRKAAAKRIISLQPRWPDRAIAEITGLSASTVGTLRPRPPVQNGPMDTRVGRDGRVVRLDISEQKATAERLLAGDPGKSLRQVARETGLSPETVRKLRGPQPLPAAAEPNGPSAAGSQLHANATAAPSSGTREGDGDAGPPADGQRAALRALAADPAVRYTANGRALVQLLSSALALDERGDELIDAVPEHCLIWLTEAARACLSQWQAACQRIDRRRYPRRH
jgi:hypothetical protein